MRNLLRYVLTGLFLLLSMDAWMQVKLIAEGQRLGRKTIELYVNDVVRLKTSKQKGWQVRRISLLQDSLILFEGETAIQWKDLQKIMIEKDNFLLKGFQRFFIAGGLLFVSLHSINQLIIGDRPVISYPVLAIGGGLVLTSFIFRELNTKRIRFGKRSHFRLVEYNYNFNK